MDLAQTFSHVRCSPKFMADHQAKEGVRCLTFIESFNESARTRFFFLYLFAFCFGLVLKMTYV